MILVSFCKVICTPLHGKEILRHWCFIFLFVTLTTMHAVLMIIRKRDHILLLCPIFHSATITILVETRRLTSILTNLQQLIQIMNHAVKFRTLRPLRTYKVATAHTKHSSQTWIVKLQTSLWKTHRHGRLTPSRRQNLMISLQKTFGNTPEDIQQDELSHSKGDSNNLRPKPNPNEIFGKLKKSCAEITSRHDSVVLLFFLSLLS